MAGHRASRLWIGFWMALALTGCGSDDGGPGEQLNLEEQQISVSGNIGSVAVGPDGRFAVVYIENGSLQMQRFKADGFKDGPVITAVHGPEDVFANNIAFGSQGDILVAYGAADGILVQAYSADGSPRGAASVVHSGPGDLERIYAGPGGQSVVVWTVTSGGADLGHRGARRLAPDGSPVGPELTFQAFTPRLAGQGFLDVAGLADGSFVAAFGSRGVGPGTAPSQLQRLTPEGAPIGATINLDVLAGSRPIDVNVDALPGGGFVALWPNQEGAPGAIEGQRFTPDGSRLGGVFRVGPYSNYYRFSVGQDGSMVVLYQDPNGHPPAFAQRLAVDGTAQGGVIPVTSTGFVAGVALGPRGRFFVVYQGPGSRGLYGRLFAE